MNVFLFPGQGSQAVGMGADLLRQDGPVTGWIRLASELTGTDLQRVLLRGPDAELARPEYLQPLLVCVSLGYFQAAREHGLEPHLVLGHSLGEITALAAADVLSPDDAVRTAAQRGRLMAEAAAGLNGGLLAVTTNQRDNVLARLGPGTAAPNVVLANDNSPEQIVLSGPRPELQQLAHDVQTTGSGQHRLLPVTGPWHHPSMSTAQTAFRDWLGRIQFQIPRLALWLNQSAQAETDPDRIRTLIAANLTGPVPWRAMMDRLRANAPHRLYEVGPGRVLSGLARANQFGPDTAVQPLGSLRALRGTGG